MQSIKLLSDKPININSKRAIPIIVCIPKLIGSILTNEIIKPKIKVFFNIVLDDIFKFKKIAS